jgi:hypothetical protein
MIVSLPKHQQTTKRQMQEHTGTLTMTIHIQLGDDPEPERAFSEKQSLTGLIFNMSEEMSEEKSGEFS